MDIVVTVPKGLWEVWIREGDAAGTPATGTEYGYTVSNKPPVMTRDRLYIVAHGKLRGYSPITRLAFIHGKWTLCRQGNAVAVTLPYAVPGFRGWRAVWWKREEEVPFPDWKKP